LQDVRQATSHAFTGEATVRERVLVILVIGATYLAAGLGFGALAGAAGSPRLTVAWRLAAWVTSLVAFAAHIAYGRTRARLPASGTAFDVAIAVALGAFGLAMAAFMHGVATHHRFPVSMLVIWPIGTAAPAFVVALVVAFLLGSAPRRR
jgi:hypothetical protein